jgi:hypothetical protein
VQLLPIFKARNVNPLDKYKMHFTDLQKPDDEAIKEATEKTRFQLFFGFNLFSLWGFFTCVSETRPVLKPISKFELSKFLIFNYFKVHNFRAVYFKLICVQEPLVNLWLLYQDFNVESHVLDTCKLVLSLG